MKTEKKKNIAGVLLRNTLLIISSLILILFLVISLTLLTFEAGFFFKGPPHPPTNLFVIISIIFVMFAFVIIYIYRKNKKIIKAIKNMEKATESVAQGDFKVQLELTKDENIDSFINNFNKMVRELDGIETLKEDFVANVSHEFKTPLSVIQSYSKALRKKLDKEARKQYEEILDNNIKKLTNLTSNILYLSKLENQEIVLDEHEFLLDEQIRQCILALQPEWTKKNLDLKLTLPEIKYFGSEELISQIWQNLISNAIKYSNENGELNIALSKKETSIDISIKDNGIGMSEDIVQKIFDKFYQADSSHSGEGNGLGLALVSRILKICNAKISVNSQPQKGSTFTVSLPIK